jgi:hypothetical protein
MWAHWGDKSKKYVTERMRNQDVWGNNSNSPYDSTVALYQHSKPPMLLLCGIDMNEILLLLLLLGSNTAAAAATSVLPLSPIKLKTVSVD